MILSPLPYPLRLSPGDLRVLPLDRLAREIRVSRAFLALCRTAGCPMEGDAAAAGQVLVWLFERYEDVRAVAGLKPLASVEGLPAQAMARLRMANALVTLLEHGRTRASDWRQKRQLRRALEQVERLADSAP